MTSNYRNILHSHHYRQRLVEWPEPAICRKTRTEKRIIVERPCPTN